LFCLCLFCFSCSEHTHEFEEVAPGLEKKLEALGERNKQVSDFPFVEIFVYSQPADSSMQLDSASYFFQRISPDYLGSESFSKELMKLNEGDSSSFKIEYRHFAGSLLDEYKSFDFPEKKKFLMHVKVGRLLTVQEYERQLAEEMRRGAVKENAYLREWLEKNNLLDNVKQIDDVYYSKVVENQGMKINAGDHLTIDYTGYFLDGTEFDSSEKGTSALYFQLGKPDQVVPGIDTVLHYMRKNEQARIYIPSHKAFGLYGSATGIVPGKTPVYFDVVVKEVEKDTLEMQPMNHP
jgi:FKBP-type peptidyl-prolyl cis-trans isomerase